jgi:hypothetical protein
VNFDLTPLAPAEILRISRSTHGRSRDFGNGHHGLRGVHTRMMQHIKAQGLSFLIWRISAVLRHNDVMMDFVRSRVPTPTGALDGEVGSVLDRWLTELLTSVNKDAAPFGFELSEANRQRLLELLESVMEVWAGKKLRFHTLPVMWLPRVGVTIMNGVRTVTSEGPPPAVKVPIPKKQALAPEWYEDALCGVAAALLVHSIGARLRRCDWKDCRAFFMARSTHRREHSFCHEKHRRAYDVAHRDPARTAANMRRYRQVLREMAGRQSTSRARRRADKNDLVRK